MHCAGCSIVLAMLQVVESAVVWLIQNLALATRRTRGKYGEEGRGLQLLKARRLTFVTHNPQGRSSSELEASRILQRRLVQSQSMVESSAVAPDTTLSGSNSTQATKKGKRSLQIVCMSSAKPLSRLSTSGLKCRQSSCCETFSFMRSFCVFKWSSQFTATKSGVMPPTRAHRGWA